MKLLLENWRQYIKEGEAEHFPWLKGIIGRKLLDSARFRLMDQDRFVQVGQGAFRSVFVPLEDPDYVIKVIHDKDPYKIQMNKDDLKLAKKYPLIFPKGYIHNPNFFWIVMERIKPLVGGAEMQKVLDKSFGAEQDALLSNPEFLENNPKFNFADPFGIMKMIMASFRFDRKELPGAVGFRKPDDAVAAAIQDIIVPVAGAAYQELSKVMHEFAIDKFEIGRGNIGYDKDYNFKIIDSSVFDSDWDPEDEE